MKFSLSTPDWIKVFKDNYCKYSVPHQGREIIAIVALENGYISNQSNDNVSNNEFYFANKKFHNTNKTNDEKENDKPVEDTDDKSMIGYATEDNEDTELMIEKTYQDDLVPLQGELLNTKTAEPTVTPIPKQEIDYHPKIVLAIPKDPQAKQLTLL
jgi:hypothetical protein